MIYVHFVIIEMFNNRIGAFAIGSSITSLAHAVALIKYPLEDLSYFAYNLCNEDRYRIEEMNQQSFKNEW